MHAHQNQLKDVAELEDMVLDVWESLGQEYLDKLYRIIPSIFIQVIDINRVKICTEQSKINWDLYDFAFFFKNFCVFFIFHDTENTFCFYFLKIGQPYVIVLMFITVCLLATRN